MACTCVKYMESLTYDGSSDEADGDIRGGAGGVEGLDQVVGEGQGDHRLTGWLHYQQRRPQSAAEWIGLNHKKAYIPNMALVKFTSCWN